MVSRRFSDLCFDPHRDSTLPVINAEHRVEDYVVDPDDLRFVRVMRMPEVFFDGKRLPQKVFCFRHGCWEVEETLLPSPEVVDVNCSTETTEEEKPCSD